MKSRRLRHALVIPLVLGLLGCATAERRGEPEIQAERQVLALFDVWASRDLDRIDSIFTPDGVYEDVPDQTSSRGREEIKEFIRECVTWAPDTKVELVSMFVSGDEGASTWIWSGTQTGEIPGLIVATGNEFVVYGASVYEFENGMISKNSDYYDAARFLAQLGVTFDFPTSDSNDSEAESAN